MDEIFIPSRCLEAIPPADLPLNLEARPVCADSGGYQVEGVLIVGLQNTIIEFCDKHSLKTSCTCVVDSRMVPSYSNDVIYMSEFGANECRAEILKHKETIEFTLHDFAERVGLIGIHFKLVEGPHVYPVSLSSRELLVLFGARPPGQQKLLRQSHICGVPIDDGDTLRYSGQTIGVGHVIADTDGVPVVQVVDQTVYLLIPDNCSSFFAPTKGGLFLKAMQAFWNGREKQLVDQRSDVKDEQGYFELLQTRTKDLEETTTGIAKEKERRVMQLKAELRVALNDWRIFASMRDAVIATKPVAEAKNRMAAERGWLKLSTHKWVASVSYIVGGIELTTTKLFPKHEGVTYIYEGYRVRLSDIGSVFISCLGYPLQGQYVHPHVPINTNTPCLGNATAVITEAATNGDPTHALLLILNWLVEGYDPLLAEHKIELWPVASEEEIFAHEQIA